MIKVLYEDNHIIVVEKPINVPSCEDDTKDLDLLSMTKMYIKNKYKKSGNVYLGLVHRLDRPVGGVMVFAKTSKAASRLNEQIRNNEMVKKYYCVVSGILNKKEDTLKDYLLKDPKTNMVIVNKNGKYAELNYKVMAEYNDMSLLEINLKTGRSHQIRVQLSFRNHPLIGDQKYNKKAIVHEQIALFAYSLSLIHPTTKEQLTFNLERPNRYPFDQFN